VVIKVFWLVLADKAGGSQTDVSQAAQATTVIKTAFCQGLVETKAMGLDKTATI
jgi:hypothetical protein